jgi:hypothetical protein
LFKNICIVCGAEFEAKSSLKKTCSENCRKIHRKTYLPEANKRSYLKHKSERLAKQKIYAQNHKEQRKIQHKEWVEKNRTKMDRTIAQRRLKIKHLVIEHYGGRCACCGESIFEFLTIDHIAGRKKGDRIRGERLYRKLFKLKYPKGYQVLCWNCNAAKGLFGECPHEI